MHKIKKLYSDISLKDKRVGYLKNLKLKRRFIIHFLIFLKNFSILQSIKLNINFPLAYCY